MLLDSFHSVLYLCDRRIVLPTWQYDGILWYMIDSLCSLLDYSESNWALSVKLSQSNRLLFDVVTKKVVVLNEMLSSNEKFSNIALLVNREGVTELIKRAPAVEYRKAANWHIMTTVTPGDIDNGGYVDQLVCCLRSKDKLIENLLCENRRYRLKRDIDNETVARCLDQIDRQHLMLQKRTRHLFALLERIITICEIMDV